MERRQGNQLSGSKLQVGSQGGITLRLEMKKSGDTCGTSTTRLLEDDVTTRYGTVHYNILDVTDRPATSPPSGLAAKMQAAVEEAGLAAIDQPANNMDIQLQLQRMGLNWLCN